MVSRRLWHPRRYVVALSGNQVGPDIRYRWQGASGDFVDHFYVKDAAQAK